MSGPLTGVRVVEFAGLGPAPFCSMLLADLGADVIRVDRPLAPGQRPRDPRIDVINRGRRSIVVDLKNPAAVETTLELIATADILIEGFRPGVMERLGLGPEPCLAGNPRLVYGRMTGWGQTGPYARTAGHDITYLAVTGALHAIGSPGGPPVPPLNLVGDFGGGALYLAFGVLAALTEARATGRGQVVDAAIVDGTAGLLAMARARLSDGSWRDERGTNLLDGGAPFYGVYECADGRHVAVGALEPQFWAELLRLLGRSDDPVLAGRDDRGRWPEVRAHLAAIFITRTRDEWTALCAGTDACLAPVLSLEEARADPHNVARGVLVDVDGVTHPAPAPRFRATPLRTPQRAPIPGRHTEQVLAEAGLDAARVADLIRTGAVRQTADKEEKEER